MTLKEALVGLIVTIVGGVVVYWFTTGYQNEQQRKQQQLVIQRQEQEARRRDAETARQRLLAEQRADAERKRRAEEERIKQPTMSQEVDFNRNGSDYKDFVAASINECLAACVREPQCKAITFTKSSRQCWMKNSVPLRQQDAGYISAVKVGA